LITDKLKELLTNQIVSLIDSGQVGLGGNSSSPNANALDVPSGATTTVKAVSTDENVMEVKVSVGGGAITGMTIREAGVFDSSSNMLSRVNFDGVGPFASTETLEVILIIEVE
jgi:hypothetical protein|tara:strand:- start:2818 stop:3156 length:339 start_codon:yes stop_codon:yes gene_type:complete